MDFNAKVENKIVERVVGEHSVPGINEKNNKIARNLGGNYTFRRQDIYKDAWMRQEGRKVVARIMIVYVFVPSAQRCSRKIDGCESYEREE